MTGRLFALVLGLCLSLVCGPARAQDDEGAAEAPIGTIAAAEGEVALFSGHGMPVDAEPGQDIHRNDVIETGPDSRVLILFIDETELTLAENARVAIDDYVFDDEDTSGNKSALSILNGAFIYAGGLIGKRENPDVTVRTPYGSIGMRGTVVWGGMLDDEYNVFVQEGAVTFATDRGRVNVGAGEGTSVYSRTAIPARATAWGEEKIGRATRTVALRNVADAKARVGLLKQKHEDMRARHRDSIMRRQEMKQDIQQNRRMEIRQKREEMHKEVRPGGQTGMRQERTPPSEERNDKGTDSSTGNAARDSEMKERKHLKAHTP